MAIRSHRRCVSRLEERVSTGLVRTKNGTLKQPFAKLYNMRDLADWNSQPLESKNHCNNFLATSILSIQNVHPWVYVTLSHG